MADSETSRTTPAADPKNSWLDDPTRESVSPLAAPASLLYTTAEFLLSRADKRNRLEVRRDGGTPTPARTLWKRWYGTREKRLRAGKLKSALHAKVLKEAGHLPSVELRLSGQSHPIIVDSFRSIKRQKGRFNARDLAAARNELRRRKLLWDEAASRFDYEQAEAEEHKLIEHEEMLRRLLRGRRPVCVAEVAAKLHCLLVTEDPHSNFKSRPWPELRIILDDLVHLAILLEIRGEHRE
jgi:hypothetical protein